MAWYRLYRPQTVDDLALSHVKQYMKNVLKTGKYAQAYLFCGPKGVGKTSTARILARILNDPQNAQTIVAGSGPLREPSNDDELLQRISQGRSQVVIELDAASHRGIDDVRGLQEQVSVIPVEGLVRVVILDEAHMLTTEAFNALLKLLEEPPSRVVFVLATTEAHKIPATVQSRCETLLFRQATQEEAVTVLRSIAQREKIKISDEELGQVAQAAAGSLRDAVKILESVCPSGAIDPDRWQAIVNAQDQARLLLELLAKQSAVEMVAFFNQAKQGGRNFSQVEKALLMQLEQRLHRAIERGEAAVTIKKILALFEHLASRLGGNEPLDGLNLELACLRWCYQDNEVTGSVKSGGKTGGGQATARQSANSQLPSAEVSPPKKEGQQLSVQITNGEAENPPATAQVEEICAPPQLPSLLADWPKFLLEVRTRSQALESLLRLASPSRLDEDKLEIVLQLPFHQEKLQSAKYADLFRLVLSERWPGIRGFTCRVEPPAPVAPAAPPTSSTSESQLLSAVEEAVMSAFAKSPAAAPVIINS